MPASLANKIAAGEVVQRPASAAKELLENAVDAGARDVTLVLRSSGAELIQVVDDGCGMSPDDARACFRRHATSKIFEMQDLDRIRTLGFRGEALASIAAVAQVELRTKRRRDDAGFRVRIEGGDVEASEPCATRAGTSVAVRNLFFNVPARRNFLKTPATELRHIVETFQTLALSHPEIAFRLVNDEMEMYRLPGESGEDFMESLRGRIEVLFDDGRTDRLVPVEEQTSYLSVRGFVGEPELHRKSRGEQYLFVNERAVRNRSIEHAIYAAYADLLPEGAYPFFALFLTLDPSRVDVNVHPAKAEVKFDDDRGVYTFLKSIVRKGLGSALLTPQVGAFDERLSGRPLPESFSIPTTPGKPSQAAPGKSRAAGDVQDAGRRSAELYGGAEAAGFAHWGPPSGRGRETDRSGVDDSLLWQLHDRYVLTQIRSGLMILDQNAAHERILYERSLDHIQNGVGLSQQLLFPQSVEFSASDFELMKELLPDLRSLGFDLETLSGRSAAVRGVPSDIRAGDEKSVLEDVLAQFMLNREDMKVSSRVNLARSLARRSAIRPGTRLSPKEMRSLIDQLFACEMPYACPQGRPTIVKIPIEELDKRFRR